MASAKNQRAQSLQLPQFTEEEVPFSSFLDQGSFPFHLSSAQTQCFIAFILTEDYNMGTPKLKSALPWERQRRAGSRLNLLSFPKPMECTPSHPKNPMRFKASPLTTLERRTMMSYLSHAFQWNIQPKIYPTHLHQLRPMNDRPLTHHLFKNTIKADTMPSGHFRNSLNTDVFIDRKPGCCWISVSSAV